jgi:cobalamin 5''-phosphate synthase/cobalamin synthase
MKQQLNLFLHALQFYSRIPVGRTDYSEDNLTRSLRFLPLVGIIVGAIGGAIFLLFMLVFPQTISATAAIIAMVAVTGALHEDGLSDFFDGFGGGYTKERILEIMKDSRIGAYGVVSLIFLFLAKFSLYVSIDAPHLPLVLIAAHALSRFAPVVLMRISTYVRTEKSKSSHSRNHLNNTTLIVAFVFAVLPLTLIPWQISLVATAVYALILIFLKRYTEKKIGGFTGDILGTLQQFCEVAFYLVYVGIIPYI